MLTKKQVRSSSNEKLREYIKTVVKPNIRMWQDEGVRIDAVVRNREMRVRKEQQAKK